ncbi:MAG: hypothetical protein AAFZ07_03975 [Actinomycetota bacterium]
MKRIDEVIEDWVLVPYDDHGPWDADLAVVPLRGWRRRLERVWRGEVYEVTEWCFSPTRPAADHAVDLRAA